MKCNKCGKRIQAVSLHYRDLCLECAGDEYRQSIHGGYLFAVTDDSGEIAVRTDDADTAFLFVELFDMEMEADGCRSEVLCAKTYRTIKTLEDAQALVRKGATIHQIGG